MNAVEFFARDVNQKVGMPVRIQLLLHMLNCLLNGSFVYIIMKTPRVRFVMFKCQLFQSFINVLFYVIPLILLCLLLIGVIQDVESNADFKELLNISKFKQILAIIVIEEIVSIAL